MGILLTKEEQSQYCNRISTCTTPEMVFTDNDGSFTKNYLFVTTDAFLKAQARKVLDELEKECPHYGGRKINCPECMAEIRKELEGK